MKIGAELNCPLFYQNGNTPADYFPDENQFFIKGKIEYLPWKNEENSLNYLIRRWEEQGKAIDLLFKERKNKETKPFMIEAISIFLKALYYSNGLPVRLNDFQKQIERLPVQPMNLSDRLLFIIEHPATHHSFIQLGELFKELEKAYYRYKIIQKRAASK